MVFLPADFGATVATKRRHAHSTARKAEAAALRKLVPALRLVAAKMSTGEEGPITRLFERIGERIAEFIDGLFQRRDDGDTEPDAAAQRDLGELAQDLQAQLDGLRGEWEQLQARSAEGGQHRRADHKRRRDHHEPSRYPVRRSNG